FRRQVEEPKKGVLIPTGWKAEKVEEVPELYRVHLHWRGGEEHETLRATSQPPHEAEQRVRPLFADRTGTLAPRVVCFIKDDEIPRFGIHAKLFLAVSSTHELARRDDGWLTVPVCSRHNARFDPAHGRRRAPS